MGGSKRLHAGSILPWCAQYNGEELLAEQKWPHGQGVKKSGSFKVLGQGLDSSYLMLNEPQFPSSNSLRSKITIHHPATFHRGQSNSKVEGFGLMVKIQSYLQRLCAEHRRGMIPLGRTLLATDMHTTVTGLSHHLVLFPKLPATKNWNKTGFGDRHSWAKASIFLSFS